MKNARPPRAFFFVCSLEVYFAYSRALGFIHLSSREMYLSPIPIERIYFAGGTVSISLPVNTIGPVAFPVGEPPTGSTVTA